MGRPGRLHIGSAIDVDLCGRGLLMPWGRIDDRLAMSVKVRGLHDPGLIGQRAKVQRGESLGVWVQVLSWVSGERSDGFVTADVLDLFGWQAANERLMRAMYGRAPLLHRKTDGMACECMAGREWPDGYDYLIHDYLDRNPSRSENDVHRAKQRELKDPKLKAAVRARDKDICRYCGKTCRHSDRKSDDGLTYDHVDPEIADGMDNLVVACRGCNNKKRRRTPEQAGLALLPAPGSESGPASDLDPVTDPTTDRTTDPITDPDPDPPPAPTPPTSTNTAPDYAQTSAETTDRTSTSGSPGTGRGGPGTPSEVDPVPRSQPRPPTRIGPPTTPRGPLHGSPYLRNTRPLPEHHAGHPQQPDDIPADPEAPFRWPPGSVPVIPPDQPTGGTP